MILIAARYKTGVRAFDWLDLVIIAVVLLAALRGYRRGAASQLLSYGGLGLGLIIGIAIAPFAVGLVTSLVAKAVVALVVVLGAGALLSGIGRRLGFQASRLIRRMHLSPVDSVAGAAVAGVIALALCLVAANLLARGPSSTLSSAITRSAVITNLDGNLPAGLNQITHFGQRVAGLGGLVTGVTKPKPSGGRGAGLGPAPAPRERARPGP